MGAPAEPTDDVKKPPATLTHFLSLIGQYLALHRVDNATFLAERCVADHPDSTEAVYYLALCHIRAGKPQAARCLLDRQASLTPALRYLSAQCSFDLKDYDKAQELLLQPCRQAFKQSGERDMNDWIVQTTVRAAMFAIAA